jgi:hypothetical protein
MACTVRPRTDEPHENHYLVSDVQPTYPVREEVRRAQSLHYLYSDLFDVCWPDLIRSTQEITPFRIILLVVRKAGLVWAVARVSRKAPLRCPTRRKQSSGPQPLLWPPHNGQAATVCPSWLQAMSPADSASWTWRESVVKRDAQQGKHCVRSVHKHFLV